MMDFTEAYPDRSSTVASAVQAGNVKVLKQLLASGACIDVRDNRGWTPLHEAVCADGFKCVQLLLNKATKEDVNARTWEGETPLFIAARHASLKILKLLIQHGADPNICTNEEASPLLQAVSHTSPDCASVLIENGADVNHQIITGWSPLHEVACSKSEDCLSLLLNSGAKINIRDDFGITPVFTAAQYGNFDGLVSLMKHGADPNSTAYDNATPLYLAAQEGYSNCVEYLLEHGASAEIHIKDSEEFRPIHAAAHGGHLRSLQLLIPPSLSLMEGSNPNKTLTPLHLAARRGHNEAVKMLLKAGCDLDCGMRNPSKKVKDELMHKIVYGELDEPPFYSAIEHGHYDTAKLLLELGATICDPCSEYCLLNMFSKDIKALQLLLDRGPDVCCRHTISSPLGLVAWNAKYLTCLMSLGLRFRLHCQAKHSICPTKFEWDLRFDFLDMLTINNLMKAISCFVDRLNPCEHCLTLIQEKGCYNELVTLTREPASLLHLSRVAITEHMGTARAPKIIPQMDFLPCILQDYLLYKDVDSTVVFESPKSSPSSSDSESLGSSPSHESLGSSPSHESLGSSPSHLD